ncbi:MAG TPA: flavodoxin family protein [Bacillota bacterium]|nr:flavodoxin family protein [Bacillota bacterium]
MRKLLVFNGSPKKQGTVGQLLRAVSESAGADCEIEWIDINDLTFKPCQGCMKCRTLKRCVLPHDDAHDVSEKIKQADGLIIGTPVYWGNMNGYLKMLFDRIVPSLMDEKKNGLPVALHRGKKAVIVTACTTQWPFNFIARESRGAIAALHEILGYSGYKVVGKLVKPGTKLNASIPKGLIQKACKLGRKLSKWPRPSEQK